MAFKEVIKNVLWNKQNEHQIQVNKQHEQNQYRYFETITDILYYKFLIADGHVDSRWPSYSLLRALDRQSLVSEDLWPVGQLYETKQEEHLSWACTSKKFGDGMFS